MTRHTEIDQQCINTIRTLSMDAVQAANSGHPGTAMAMAPVVYWLWQHFLRFDPHDPIWPNRDRFVLSIGHASMLLGHDSNMIEQLSLDLTHATVAERLKPVFCYVHKLTLRPDHVDQADVTAMYEAGWDETAVTHAALVCAYFSFMNRWVDGLGIEANPAVVQMAADMLHKKGYMAIVELLNRAHKRSTADANTDEEESVSS